MIHNLSIEIYHLSHGEPRQEGKAQRKSVLQYCGAVMCCSSEVL